ncbi:MAG TPA: hypothetical protein PKX92_06450 [Edaphocola sp.]|nr:hypothetical protein [Edaphocola sp.]
MADNFDVFRHRPADQLSDTHPDPRKNKTPPPHKKIEFTSRTSGTFGFALPANQPFCKAKRATFSLRTKDSTDETNTLCRTST